MNARFKIAIALAALFAAGQLWGQGSRTTEAQLKAAHDKAEFEGDPKGAIEMYKRIADGKDQVLAVRALLGMADAYRKLGDPEAQKIYERIVKEFSNQKDVVAESQARLASLTAQSKQKALQVWKGEEVNASSGSVSGDGRFLSFQDLKTGMLAIRNLETGENRLLTTDSKSWENGFAEESSISSDGRQVARLAGCRMGAAFSPTSRGAI
jgi:hypothetical protein